jgi:predicted RNA-binding Zn-ribbon protein involved in translation (DUF1610 family)
LTTLQNKEAVQVSVKTVGANSFNCVRDMQTGQATTIITFPCPHCGTPHEQREISSAIPANFHTVFYSLPCGPVRVRMPWAPEAE